MKRRKFIQSGLAGVMAPVFCQGLGLKVFSASALPVSTCDFDDRILVILYNFGANDIVNNMVPITQFGTYMGHRPNIYLPENSLITLDDTLGDDQLLGMHPSLSDFKNHFYDNEMLAVIQRVGYPTPNRSHFSSEDIIFKGAQGNDSFNAIEDGWLGRFLKDKYPTYKGRPFGEELDPLGIILGSTPNTGFHTVDEHQMEINLSGQDPAGFYSIISSLSGEPIDQIPNTEQGEMLNYMSIVEKSTQVYSERISSVFNSGVNNITYPDSSLGDQMKTIAKLISGGSRTKVYMARKSGWDTHVNQVNVGDTATGNHANLLKDVNDSLKAFQDDLAAQGLSHKVLTVVFSEFTRKIIENGSYGTDHGTVSSMYVIGDAVKHGVYGDNLDLSDIDAQGAANPAQLANDYRGVWSTVLQDWLGADDGALLNTFPLADSTTVLNRSELEFVLPADAVDPACYFEPTPALEMTLDITVFLEGFFNQATGLMTTNLRDNGLLPTRQPFSESRLAYFGTEQVPSFAEGIVDWVLVELQSPSGLQLSRKAALLREDGKVLELDGVTMYQVSDIYPEPFKVAIYSMTHLGVLTSAEVEPVQNGTYVLDLSLSQDAVEGEAQLKNLGSVYALIGGDMDQNGVINTSDYNKWKRGTQALDYHQVDLNASGLPDIEDYEIWEANRSTFGNPKIHKALGS